jgi:hypothetical protein
VEIFGNHRIEVTSPLAKSGGDGSKHNDTLTIAAGIFFR